jgi:hypothetical protein
LTPLYSLTKAVYLFFFVAATIWKPEWANVLLLTVDYRCEDRKEVGELRGDNGAKIKVLTPSFTKPRPSPPKNELFSQEMHLKIPLLAGV